VINKTYLRNFQVSTETLAYKNTDEIDAILTVRC